MSFWNSFGDSLMEGYAFGKQLQDQEQKQQLLDLIKPYIQQAKDAQKTTIQSNPNYRLTDFIPKPTTNDPNQFLPMGDFAPKQQEPQSSTTLKQAMPMNDWMANYGWLVSKQIGADALPWAVRTGDQNRLVSAIKGGLAMSADEQDNSRRKWFETSRDTGLKLQKEGRDLHETGVQYGTNPSLTNNQNILAKQFGFPYLTFEYAQSGGYKPAVAQSQIDRNRMQGEAAVIRANRPLATRGGGSGGGGLTVAQQRQDDAKLLKARALMSAYSDSGKLAKDGSYVPYTPEEQARFNEAAEYIKAHDPAWQSGGQQSGRQEYTPNYRQADDIIAQIKAKNPDATDDEIYQYLSKTLGYSGGE